MLSSSKANRLVSGPVLAPPSPIPEASIIHEASAALIDHSNEEILAWLKLVRSARSIEPISEQRPGNAQLSSLQIRALFSLKDCPDDRLLACLELARLSRDGPDTVAFALGSSTDSRLDNNLSSPFEQPDLSPLESSLWSESTGFDAFKPSTGPRNRQSTAEDVFRLQPVRSVNSASSRYADNHYWCTVCETPNSYRDSGNWKKHEKEHETVFVCGLDHAIADSWTAQNASTKRFSCKRRDIMVNHLYKSHGMTALEQSRDLAEKWRISIKKQAWSCGFCGKLFLNFTDRLKHIDIEHFKKFEHIQAWDLNKLIHGLVLQPTMVNAWKKRTASLPAWLRPEDLVWEEAFAKSMRSKLEVGPQNELEADQLVDAVYSASKTRESWNQSAITPPTVVNYSIPGTNLLSLSNPSQLVAAPGFGYGTDQCQVPLNARATTAHTEHSLSARLPAHAYGHDSTTVKTLSFLDQGDLGTYVPRPFYSS